MGDSLCRLMHGVSFLPNTTDQARANVREMKALGVDAIKVIYLDQAHTGNASVPVMRSELMQAIIDEAHSLGLKTYVHAATLAHAKEVLRAGADVLAHSVADAAVDDEFIGLMRMCRDHFRISEELDRYGITFSEPTARHTGVVHDQRAELVRRERHGRRDS
jgi:imidazolonepropionase-like amidohydrolase